MKPIQKRLVNLQVRRLPTNSPATSCLSAAPSLVMEGTDDRKMESDMREGAPMVGMVPPDMDTVGMVRMDDTGDWVDVPDSMTS